MNLKLFRGARRIWLRFALTLLFIGIAAASFVLYMTSMPGKSFSGALPPLSAEESEISSNLNRHVAYLAGTIGERNVISYEPLQKTAQYIEGALKAQGYEVKSQEYVVQMRKVRNLISEIHGGARANEIVIIGAHYDTVFGCPGADDNTSGVAALLELARLLKNSHPARTVRFVAFVNEEPPHFQTENMGSWVYAKEAHRKKENIVAALSLETIGMYSDAEGSQQYPAGFKSLYPSKGSLFERIGAGCGSFFQGCCAISIRGKCRARVDSRRWLVGPLVVLARRLSGHHGD